VSDHAVPGAVSKGVSRSSCIVHDIASLPLLLLPDSMRWTYLPSQVPRNRRFPHLPHPPLSHIFFNSEFVTVALHSHCVSVSHRKESASDAVFFALYHHFTLTLCPLLFLYCTFRCSSRSSGFRLPVHAYSLDFLGLVSVVVVLFLHLPIPLQRCPFSISSCLLIFADRGCEGDLEPRIGGGQVFCF